MNEATLMAPKKQETRSHAVKLTLCTEVWDWLGSEADFLNRSQSAHFSDLITTLYECQKGRRNPEIIKSKGQVYE